MGLTSTIAALMALLFLGAGSEQTYSAQVLDVKVTKDDVGFRIEMHVVINAAAREAFLALQDYSAMLRFNPDLRSVAIEKTADPKRVLLLTTIHTCVLLFCKTMHQRQIMTAISHARGGVLHAELVPEGSAFGGKADWTVRPCGADGAPACLDVQIELVPRFWIAPVIGSWVIRRKMHEEAQLTSTGLEQLAQAPISRKQ